MGQTLSSYLKSYLRHIMVLVEVIMKFKRRSIESSKVFIGMVSTIMSTNILPNVIVVRETRIKQWLCLAYFNHYLYQSVLELIFPWILWKDFSIYMVKRHIYSSWSTQQVLTLYSTQVSLHHIKSSSNLYGQCFQGTSASKDNSKWSSYFH